MLHRVAAAVGPGGTVDKEQGNVIGKVIAGDNFGTISVIDTNRKLTVERFKVSGMTSRRIIALSSYTVEWAGTQLTYVAVVARGCTTIQILCFKHNDCKLKEMHSLNVDPAMQNQVEPELNNE